MARVSIIMPMYNTSSFIEVCIQSIINQTYKEWELIIVDDFSDDDSRVKVSKFTKEDDRISLYQNTKKGIIPALQLGYKMSTGHYVTRMDSDDIMPPTKIESLLCVLETQDDVAVGKVSYFSDSQLSKGYVNYAAWLNSLIDNKNHFENIYKECVIPSPCWMMYKSTFERIGGFTGYGYPEDYDLVFRMYANNLNVVTIDKILHRWRDHDSRASRNDINYSDQSFLPLKIHYFFQLDYEPKKRLVLWGGGSAGKSIAKVLIDKDILFDWYTDNHNKIGHNIYGVILKDSKNIVALRNCQIITAVRIPTFKIDNKEQLIELTSEGNNILHFY